MAVNVGWDGIDGWHMSFFLKREGRYTVVPRPKAWRVERKPWCSGLSVPQIAGNDFKAQQFAKETKILDTLPEPGSIAVYNVKGFTLTKDGLVFHANAEKE